MPLHGKVIVVTGASRGIGATIARALVGEGAVVVGTARSAAPPPAKIDTTVPALHLAPLDVTAEASVRDFFAWTDTGIGRIDALVNNAGVGVWKPLHETTLDEWNAIVATNLTGVFLCMREVIPRMIACGGGRIVNIGSIAGTIPIAENGAYGASKYGVRGLTEIVNEEYKQRGVRASLISLGAVVTEMWSERAGFDRRDMLTPDDVAATVIDIVSRPLHVRVDEVRLYPAKGVL